MPGGCNGPVLEISAIKAAADLFAISGISQPDIAFSSCNRKSKSFE